MVIFWQAFAIYKIEWCYNCYDFKFGCSTEMILRINNSTLGKINKYINRVEIATHMSVLNLNWNANIYTFFTSPTSIVSKKISIPETLERNNTLKFMGRYHCRNLRCLKLIFSEVILGSIEFYHIEYNLDTYSRTSYE